jgi:acyl-coenzyme A thioesterase PaaI-like protein
VTSKKQFGDELTSYLHYSSERTSDTSASSWIPWREDLSTGRGTIAPVTLSFLVDSTAGVVCGAAARPDWIVTSDLHLRVVSDRWRGAARADATVIRSSKAGVLGQVVVVDEGDGDRVMAVGSVNHVHIELAEPIDVPLEMPIGVRYGTYDSDRGADRALMELVNVRMSEQGAGLDLAGLAVNPLKILHGAFHAAMAVEVAQARCGGTLSDLVTRFMSPVRGGPAVAVPMLTEVSNGRATVQVSVHDHQRPTRTASQTWVGLTTLP